MISIWEKNLKRKEKSYLTQILKNFFINIIRFFPFDYISKTENVLYLEHIGYEIEAITYYYRKRIEFMGIVRLVFGLYCTLYVLYVNSTVTCIGTNG